MRVLPILLSDVGYLYDPQSSCPSPEEREPLVQGIRGFRKAMPSEGPEQSRNCATAAQRSSSMWYSLAPLRAEDGDGAGGQYRAVAHHDDYDLPPPRDEGQGEEERVIEECYSRCAHSA